MTLTKAELEHFTGTTEWYKHPLFKDLVYTDGVRYLAIVAQAYWLIEAIFSYQKEPIINRDEMLSRLQIWTLEVKENRQAILSCWRDTDDLVVSQEIEYTEFPIKDMKFYLCDTVLMLPSEY